LCGTCTNPYKDFTTDEHVLPWARLHGCKEYIHMAEVLAQYPDVKATFNFVPCLVEQILEHDPELRALVKKRRNFLSQ
jgi:alpha-amylase/alpha-mannosidase (GH57 family)